MDQAHPDSCIREPSHVAKRALALYAVWYLSTDEPRHDILNWLKSSGVEAELKPREREFVATPQPTLKQRIEFSWHSERLYVLLWSLNRIASLPPANMQCDTGHFTGALISLPSRIDAPFVTDAQLRSYRELSTMSDSIRQLHWTARDAKINQRKLKAPIDIEIIQERHHAINWLIGDELQEWDDVLTDTY